MVYPKSNELSSTAEKHDEFALGEGDSQLVNLTKAYANTDEPHDGQGTLDRYSRCEKVSILIC